MAATWTPCWRVTYAVGYTVDGAPMREYVASRTQWSVTVRRPGQTRGGERYSPSNFDEHFGATPDEAIEKYLEKQRCALQSAQLAVEALEIMIRRAEELQALQLELQLNDPLANAWLPATEEEERPQ